MLTHLAIIPDGNRRWAQKRGLPTFEGHRRGFERIKELGKKAREMGIKIFTVWAFSTENWARSKKEIHYLMGIYKQWIDENLKQAIKDKIHIVHLGRKDRIPSVLKKKIVEAEEKTKRFNAHYFVIALDYGGRDEVLRATQQVQSSKFKVQNLTEETFTQFLDTRDLPYPYPDLVIRTSGEIRMSGFMPWQAAYSEWIFYPKYLPDFTANDLEHCIKQFEDRKRRFGK